MIISSKKGSTYKLTKKLGGHPMWTMKILKEKIYIYPLDYY